MPCLTDAIHNNQIILKCSIRAMSEEKFDYKPFKALVDTGAQVTCIAERIAQKLNLNASGWNNISGVGGLVQCDTYMIDLGIFITETQHFNENDAPIPPAYGKNFPIEVPAIPELSHDILIGMDIIMQCNLQIHTGNQFTFCI